MARPRSTTRDELLTATVAYVAEHGIGDLSLRPLAEALGTSHRMLLFHFGTKDQLMVEVVRAVEAQQRATLLDISADRSRPAFEQMQEQWTQLLEPALRNNIRLFYEVYADALRGRKHTAGFLDEAMTAWLDAITELVDPTEARLMLAVVRGLLLDLAATDDVAGVDAAMQLFAELYARQSSTPNQSSMTGTPRPSE